MQENLYPKQSKSQEIGKKGQAYFHYFMAQWGWSYRPTPQESDFGVDGYIDIVVDENVIGKSVAVQVKCGDTYMSKRTEGGIRYEGKNKHINYYLNLQIPIFLVVLNESTTQGFWVLFDIERTSPRSTGWWIEVPKTNELNLNFKDFVLNLIGDIPNYLEEVQRLWMMSEQIKNSSLMILPIPRSDVQSLNFSTLESAIKKLTKNKEMTLQKRLSLEICFPEYEPDPRELYEIQEVRTWLKESIRRGFPWFYFLNHESEVGLILLYACTCQFSVVVNVGTHHYMEATGEEKNLWLDNNLKNLNSFLKSNDISYEIEMEIFDRMFLWVEKALKIKIIY